MADSSSGEKTEKASSKKKKDARKKGQVRKSNEINTAVSVIVVFAFLSAMWDKFVVDMGGIFTTYLSPSIIPDAAVTITKSTVETLYMEVVGGCVVLLLPLAGVVMLTGTLTNVLQTGLLFSTESLKPSFNKINPMSGFKRIFSVNTLVELIKSILKALVLAYVVYGEYSELMYKFPGYMRQEPMLAFTNIMETCFSIALKMGVVLAIIAAIDYLYQWWKYEKDLMMTKQEVKEENKQQEGDPQIKSKIKQKQRQMSAARMMQRVPEADVVITNPTHYAIAIRYDYKKDRAPVVLAKGQDMVARRIRQKAEESGVTIVENKPVAQALYAACEIGDMIPQELYQAIADILFYVYKLKNRGGPMG